MELSTEVTERSAFPLGKVSRCCAHWRCTVTDEVRPPSVGVTAAEPPWLPLRRELDCCIKDLSNKTEGEITRGDCLH